MSPAYYAMYIENAQNTTYSLSISEPFERVSHFDSCDSCIDTIPRGTWVSTAPNYSGEGWSSGLIELHPGDIIHGVIKMTFRPDECGGEGTFASGAIVNVTLANGVQCGIGFDIWTCGHNDNFSGDWGTRDWYGEECGNQLGALGMDPRMNLVNFTINPPYAQAFEPAMV